MQIASRDVISFLAKLENWFLSMRNGVGFTGPIAHWWESSFLYCGPMSDWRYEGILAGYARLYEVDKNQRWLEAAINVADDLVASQLPSGSFRSSSFQRGPIEGGTPHEAAVDVGLLELACVLRKSNDPRWMKYFEVAAHNINAFLLGRLWNGSGFVEQPGIGTLVPNKNATALEALLLYEVISGQDMEQYISAAQSVIMSAQVKSGPRRGGTIHTGTGNNQLAISIYTARSLSGLLRSQSRKPSKALIEAIEMGLEFLLPLVTDDGLSFGMYADGRMIYYPKWVAASGDMLRLLLLCRELGCNVSDYVTRMANILIDGQLASGGVMTARGFSRAGRSDDGFPGIEFRDVVPVVGWCDKAWRAMSMLRSEVSGDLDPIGATCSVATVECAWKGRRCVYSETQSELNLWSADTGRWLYRWKKGALCPNVCML